MKKASIPKPKPTPNAILPVVLFPDEGGAEEDAELLSLVLVDKVVQVERVVSSDHHSKSVKGQVIPSIGIPRTSVQSRSALACCLDR